MGYANCICRVGALAVALGVGAAVATAPGIAYATPSDSGSSSADAPSAPSAPSSPSAGSSPGVAAPEAPDASDPPDAPSAVADSPSNSLPGNSTAAKVTVRSSGGAHTSGADEDADSDATLDESDAGEQQESPITDEDPATAAAPIAPPAPEAPTRPAEPVSTHGGGASSGDAVDQGSTSTPAADLETTAENTGSADEPPAAELLSVAAPPRPQSAATNRVRAAAVQTTTTPDAAIAATPVGPVSAVTDVVDTVFTFASSLVTAALGPFGTGSPSPALWALLAWTRREIGEIGQTLIPAAANPLAAVQTIDLPNPLDPGSILDFLQEIVLEAGAWFRNFIVPILWNRTPVASPQQIELDLAAGEVSGPIPFTAVDPDGDPIVFTVPAKGQAGGPQHGTVVVDNATGTFTYRPDETFTGTDTFSFVVTDSGFHLHLVENFFNAAFGIFNTSLAGGHRAATTVTVFNNMDIVDTVTGEFNPISGTFKVLTYNVAGLPFPLSSAEFPRETNTLEIGQRINSFDIVQVQEDFAYHPYLVATAAFPDQTAPLIPTWYWPIGTPFSDGLNTFSSFTIKQVIRQAWFGCHADNCLTPKGFSMTRVVLPGGEEMDIYNAHMNTGGGEFTNNDIAQLSNFIQQNSAGRAVIVTGDFNERYSDPGQTMTQFLIDNGLTDAWLELVPGATDVAPFADTCDYADSCEQLDRIFYRSATPTDPMDPASSPVQLKAEIYVNEGLNFLNSSGQDLSDHRPQSVTFSYIVRNNGPVVTQTPAP